MIQPEDQARTDDLTKSDVIGIHWFKKGIMPLLVIGIVALTTCATDLTKSVAALKTHNQIVEEREISALKVRADSANNLEAAIVNQQLLKSSVDVMGANQVHIQRDIAEIKEIVKKISESVK